MINFPNTKIEKAAAVKGARYYLYDPYYDAETKQVIATDGYILAILPATNTDSQLSGPIPITAIKQARKLDKTALQIDLSSTEHAETMDSMKAPRPDVQFPDFKRIIKEPQEDDFTLGIDAALLFKLSEALNNSKKSSVKLRFSRDSRGEPDFNSSIRVEVNADDDRFGVIMPMRT